jgi:hypothetical protein
MLRKFGAPGAVAHADTKKCGREVRETHGAAMSREFGVLAAAVHG